MSIPFYIIAAVSGALIGFAADYAVYFFAPREECGEAAAEPYKIRGVLRPKRIIIVIVSVLIYILAFVRFGLSVELPFALFISAILIAVFFIDLKYRIIPDELVLAGIAGGIAALVCNIFRPLYFMSGPQWWNPLLGMAIGSGFLLLVALLGFLIYGGEGAMGMGDVKIFAPIGLFLGWKMTITALLITMLAGGLISVILMIAGLKNRKDAIPFGPFIVIGTLIVLFFGQDILNLYLNGII